MQNEGGRMFRQKSIVKGNKKSPIQTKQERWNTEPKTQEHTGIQKDKHQEPKVNRAARERTWKHNLTKRNTQVKTSRSRLTITKEGETVRKLEADTHQKTNLQWKQEVPKKQILNTEPRRLREQGKRTTTLREEQTGNHWVWRFKHTKIKIKNRKRNSKSKTQSIPMLGTMVHIEFIYPLRSFWFAFFVVNCLNFIFYKLYFNTYVLHMTYMYFLTLYFPLNYMASCVGEFLIFIHCQAKTEDPNEKIHDAIPTWCMCCSF